MKIVEVVFPIPLDKSFSYIIPERFEGKIKIGARVRVPFAGRITTGYAVEIKTASLLRQSSEGQAEHQNDKTPGRMLKEIVGIIDEELLINEELIQLSKWISSYYFCPLGKVLNVVMPLKTPNLFKNDDLLPKNNIENAKSTFSILTEEQKNILQLVEKAIEKKENSVFLLYASEGRGKTETLLQAAANAIDRGTEILVLTGEISLSESLIKRFVNVFGNEKIAVLHSGLTDKQRALEFDRIRNGIAKIVIGTRLAVFAPIKNLGFIVVHGEEDASFKEEKDPKYNAREIALQRGMINSCPVVLESNSPSFESYYKAAEQEYTLLKLDNGFDAPRLPQIEVIKKTQDGKDLSSSRFFSPQLQEKINLSLLSKEKVVIFLNRKGLASCVICSECGTSISCPNCGIPLILSKNKRMTCNYCSYKIIVPDFCPNCRGSKLKEFGLGTQKIFQEIKRVFPEAYPAIFDTDSAKKNEDRSQIIKNFRNGKNNVLITTQIILAEDIGDVSLLAILSADSILGFPDFRASEHAFQLLTKLIEKLSFSSKGKNTKVVIQTFNPFHPVFDAVSKMDFKKIYENEIKTRQALNYPPFSSLVNIVVSAANEPDCIKTAESLLEKLERSKEKNNLDVSILGPSPAPFTKLRSKYRYQILLKGRKGDLNMCLRQFLSEPASKRKVKISIDVDPLKMM